MIIWAMLLFCSLQVAAQIAMPDTVCAGMTRTYSVNNPSVPSTYTWKIDGVTQATTTNSIVITWTTPGTFLLTVQEHSANGCDGDVQSGFVFVNPNVTPTFTPIAPLCQNSAPPPLPATSSNGIAGTWSPATINTSSSGTTVYTFTPVTGQCATTATLSVTVNPFITNTTNATICANQLPYIWNGNAYNAAGSYVDTLTSATGCDTVVTLNLSVNSLITTTSDVTICSNQLPFIWNGNAYNTAGSYVDTLSSTTGCDTIATLNLSVGSLITTTTSATVCDDQLPFSWHGNTYSATGTYLDTLPATIGCDTVARLNLTVTPKPQAIRYPTVTTNANTPTPLSARSPGNINQYQWNPSTGLNSSSLVNPIFNYDKTTQYLVTITADGCTVTDTLLVKVVPVSVFAEDVFVPGAWSPNSDGHNDQLIPFTKNIQAFRYFKVFNRWGELVFETNTMGQGWDGIYKGKPQVVDTYTWTAEAVGVSGKIIKRSGHAVLLR